jgi:hypothetical protein
LIPIPSIILHLEGWKIIYDHTDILRFKEAQRRNQIYSSIEQDVLLAYIPTLLQPFSAGIEGRVARWS